MLRLALVLFLTVAFHQAQTPTYDLAINNGRVIDPASGLDAIRHIGVQGGKITAISVTPLD